MLTATDAARIAKVHRKTVLLWFATQPKLIARVKRLGHRTIRIREDLFLEWLANL
jgi:hypothetical protein